MIDSCTAVVDAAHHFLIRTRQRTPMADRNFVLKWAHYWWSDVLEWLDRNTFQRTDDPRQQR
jgi:hypothetical protein